MDRCRGKGYDRMSCTTHGISACVYRNLLPLFFLFQIHTSAGLNQPPQPSPKFVHATIAASASTRSAPTAGPELVTIADASYSERNTATRSAIETKRNILNRESKEVGYSTSLSM